MGLGKEGLTLCGICGAVSKAPVNDPEPVRKMRDALFHRGPDDEGGFASARVALGVRRLSIIDLEGGQQPLYNEDRSLILVANGEIYNFVELRVELEARGHRFATGSDCETILHLYEEHGFGCVEHLRGMFAFALWDSRRERLLLARDRMGEKPLYFYETAGQLYFASELKGLLASGRVPFDLDPDAVNLYFHYQFVPEPMTPLVGVRKLPPGHLMMVDTASWLMKEHRYWGMEEAPLLHGNPAEEIRAELEEIGRLIVRSDVPIGVALSGGIDSSAVAALVAKSSDKPVCAFSVGYEGRPDNDERDLAKELAGHLGMDFFEIELDAATVVGSFPEQVRAWDDPIADMSGFCYRAISELVHRHGIKVLVQGQGGDELFWGYPWVRRAVSASSLKAELWERGWSALPRYLTSEHPERGAAMEDAGSDGRRTGPRLGWRRFREDLGKPRGRLAFYDLHPDFVAAQETMGRFYPAEFRSRLDSEGPFAPFTVAPPLEDPAVEMTRLISQIYLLENGISQGDRLSMANSVELRLPLVDHRLVEKVVGLRKGRPDHEEPPKAWLKEAVRDLLPETVVARTKRPFLTPLRTWHRGLFDAYGTQLKDGTLVEMGVLRPEAASELAEGHFPDEADSAISFKALVLEMWCQAMKRISKQPSARTKQRVVDAPDGSPQRERRFPECV
jgi:asparagine synthase (glutamine-hydrolysing)